MTKKTCYQLYCKTIGQFNDVELCVVTIQYEQIGYRKFQKLESPREFYIVTVGDSVIWEGNSHNAAYDKFCQAVAAQL